MAGAIHHGLLGDDLAALDLSTARFYAFQASKELERAVKRLEKCAAILRVQDPDEAVRVDAQIDVLNAQRRELLNLGGNRALGQKGACQ